MFTEIPNNLSSLYSELSYSYYTTLASDLTLKIFENETDELLGVKKFYQTNSAQVNIAPHIRPYAIPTVAKSRMGFLPTYRQGNISVYIKVEEDNVTSSSRQFSISRSDLELPGLISTLPLERSISDGESEILQICGASGSPVTIQVKEYLSSWNSSYERPYIDGEFVESVISSTTYTETPADGNILLFNYVASSNRDGEELPIERVKLTVTQNSETIAVVNYHIIEAVAESVRVAWLSESGSVEHYTFPVVKGVYVGDDFRHTLDLISAFEGYATRVALAEIVRSPRVWVLVDGEYVTANVESGGISVSSAGELGCVEIRVGY